MEFLKKHYEKVLLGLVVLGMTVAVGSEGGDIVIIDVDERL